MPRDANGNYTLPAGNPVVSGTTIDTTWCNPTMSDIANELTNSLSRTGEGGMLVPFQNIDGTVGAPGITWINETVSGFYRPNTNDMRVSIGGVDSFRWTADAVQIWDPVGLVWIDVADANGYLPLTGGTLTGEVLFSTGVFGGLLRADTDFAGGAAGTHILGLKDDGGIPALEVGTTSSTGLSSVFIGCGTSSIVTLVDGDTTINQKLNVVTNAAETMRLKADGTAPTLAFEYAGNYSNAIAMDSAGEFFFHPTSDQANRYFRVNAGGDVVTKGSVSVYDDGSAAGTLLYISKGSTAIQAELDAIYPTDDKTVFTVFAQLGGDISQPDNRGHIEARYFTNSSGSYVSQTYYGQTGAIYVRVGNQVETNGWEPWKAIDGTVKAGDITINAGSTAAVVFASPFASDQYSAVATVNNVGSAVPEALQIQSKTATGFTVVNNSATINVTADWMATPFTD